MGKPKTDDAFATIRAAKAAAKTLTDTAAAISAQHSELLAERKRVISAHASLDEVVANIHRLVNDKKVEWARSHGVAFVRDLGGHKRMPEGSRTERYVPPKLPHWGDLSGTLKFEDICGFFPELVKTRLVEVVTASGARFGLPKEDRAAKLAELERSIADLEDQHEQIVKGAAEVGIILQHLEAVQQRIEAAERVAARDAELAAQRARGEYLVSGSSLGPAVTGGSVGGRA
jgi:hypothetical protein